MDEILVALTLFVLIDKSGDHAPRLHQLRHSSQTICWIVIWNRVQIDDILLEPVVRVDFVEGDARAEHVDERESLMLYPLLNQRSQLFQIT